MWRRRPRRRGAAQNARFSPPPLAAALPSTQPVTTEERQQLLDEEHLRLLRLGYLIGAGANGLFALFPLIHVTIGLLMVTGHSFFPKEPPDSFNPGWFFVAFGLAFSTALATIAVLKYLAARAIRDRRSKTLCLIIAAITCLGVPYGTALGVLTLIVLSRPSVSAMFEAAKT